MHAIAFIQFALHALQNAGDSFPAVWSAISQPAAALALTAVWQGAAVALGLALCLRLAPRSPARHRFALWAAGFGVLVALQILPPLLRLIPIHIQAAAGSPLPAAFDAAAPHAWLQLNPAWSLLIASLWLAASLYRAADLAVHSLRLRKLWRTATPVEIDPASLPRSLGRISGRTLQICTTSDLERPSVIGFFAPRILIPDWLFSRLTPGELDQIVLHETEHLRRHDDWTNLLQKLCLVLFPLNPGLAWIERRLCREREMACDDGVIGITRAPRAYAACLTSLAERGLQRRAGALSLGAWHARPELVRRVHSILRHKHALSPVAARTILAAVGCVLLAGATALARCPRLIAFVPTHSPLAAQNSPAQHLAALQGHVAPTEEIAAPKGHSASTEEIAALLGHGPSTEEIAALQGHGPSTEAFAVSEGRGTSAEASAVSKGRCTSAAAEAFAVLKGHDFSRAENRSTLSRALAPEGILPRGSKTVSPHAADAASAAPQIASLAPDDRLLRPPPAVAPAPIHGSAFIVMSAWESVDIPISETSQKKTARPHDVSGKAVQQISPRISVTRMYLKIYTGDRESAWLVIQL